jgi:hypothetical protein
MTLAPTGESSVFTVFEDTHDATLDTVQPAYAPLQEFERRTTKAAWPLDRPDGSESFRGDVGHFLLAWP